MGEKIDWKYFRYPRDCLLSDNAQAALIKVASSGKCDPFMQCKKSIAGECPGETQRKCHKAVVEYEISAKTKPK